MKFRKLSIMERKKFLNISDADLALISGKMDLSELSDVLIETAIGTFPVPLGIASGFFIDGKEYVIPMATEEPSVIAAASFAASLIKTGGGFVTESSEPIMTAQVYLKQPSQLAKKNILSAKEKIGNAVNNLIPKMVERGGGFRDLEVLEAHSTLAVSIDIDVRDAMGANTVNTVAEGLQNMLKELSGGEIIMAVLTNDTPQRKAKATFRIPEKYFFKKGFSGEEICKKIIEANELAHIYPQRAVTHNKGIMNGISALALATGNDTRAIESAVHFFAQKQGKYGPLTSYSYLNGQLHGCLELPMPIATYGGSVSFWPGALLSLKILNNPSARQLSQIAVSLGLAQNLAALLALVSEGIQNGHMQLHAAKLAYEAGARGKDVRLLAAKLNQEKNYNYHRARQILGDMKGKMQDE